MSRPVPPTGAHVVPGRIEWGCTEPACCARCIANILVLLGLIAAAPAHAQLFPAAQCNEHAAQFARGRLYSDQLAQRARRAAGAQVVRKLEPGQAITMEYRFGRLNLELDRRRVIIRVRCG